jgi:hypothetical protein
MEMDFKLPGLADAALPKLAWVKLSAVVDTDRQRPKVDRSEDAVRQVGGRPKVLAVVAHPANANRPIALDVLGEITVDRRATPASITSM